ncbi:MAG: PspC domain-containing protein [Bacteroides sp.]|nr:PspC domain-containing protein [Bacteroides sp.]
MADGGKEKEDFSHTSGEKIRVEYSRRLYRNPDDKMLGGVLSGISAYFGREASWVRLIFVLLVLCGVGAPILAYFICWIAIPLARTADQKLAMRGEQVTIENIGKTVKDGFEYVKTGTQEFVRSERTQQIYRKTTNTAADILGWILKAFLILAAVVFSPAILALLFAFFIVAVVMIAVLAGSGSMLYYMLPGIDWSMITASPGIAMSSCMALLLVLGIPLGSLLYVILQHIFNWEPMASVTKWTLLILWIVGLVASFIIILHGGWMNFLGVDIMRDISWMTI